MKSIYGILISILFLSVPLASCNKDSKVTNCKLSYLNDSGGAFGNYTLTFEYGTSGNISRIDANNFSYEFIFHQDSVTVNFYNNFHALSVISEAKLNNQGLIVWEKDSGLTSQSVGTSTYSYDNNGYLLTYERQGTDTTRYEFTYSNGNAVSALLIFQTDDDTLFYTFQYFGNTVNNILVIPPDADAIMLSGLYGKISNNLMKEFMGSSIYGSVTESYEYDFDDHGNPLTMYRLYSGDTLGNTTFTWNCN